MVLTYDPKKVLVMVGNHRVTGFAEDDMVKFKPLGDGFGIYSGSDGEVGRSVDPNQTFEVTISLATTSKSNDFFSNLHKLDRATGQGMAPITIKDLSGTTLFFAAQGWVVNYPEAGRGRNIDSQDWVLNTGSTDGVVVGGNN